MNRPSSSQTRIHIHFSYIIHGKPIVIKCSMTASIFAHFILITIDVDILKFGLTYNFLSSELLILHYL